MSRRQIFHLSIPVDDLVQAKDFYINVLPGISGRETDSWADALLWGHQITLQLRPDEVLPLEEQGKRHFGFVLEWESWESARDKLIDMGVNFLSKPEVLLAGTSEEQAKMYLSDPSNNIIELKTYRDIDGTLGFE
jgi:uncharacterized protein